jgi:two-component system phosphate regulon sensor histidine kinase PhoR
MKKFSTLVLASFISLVLIFSFSLLYFILSSVKEFFIESQIRQLKELNTILGLNIRSFLIGDSIKVRELNEYIAMVDSTLKLRVTVILRDGKVIADSRAEASSMENHLHRPEITQALKYGEGTSTRFSTTVKYEQIYFAKAIKFGTGNVVFLRTSIGKENFANFFFKIQTNVINIFVLLLLFSILLSVIFSKRITKTIYLVIEASKKVSRGDFNVLLEEKGETEIGELTRNFNYMVSQMSNLFAEITQQKNFYERVLESINHAIAILTDAGEFVFLNHNYRLLFGNISPGLNYTDSVGNSFVSKQIQMAVENKRETNIEVEINGKMFYSCIKILPENSEILHLLYDITSIKQIESIKKDLVANVSHELRTPLTAIKGYIETLEEELSADQLKYVDTIKKNTERIITIVDDLLNLMSLEDVSSKLFISEVDLKQLVEQIIPTFEQKLKAKGLKLESIIEDNLPIIKADAFRLEQVFINLIDNAIKYSDKGTIRVHLLKEDEDTIKIIVEDEGIGIPVQHQERIFERFYTVDKSRSRKSGGTGLGLAIVKHIILLHDGHIRVESREGGGTKFIIHLPIS